MSSNEESAGNRIKRRSTIGVGWGRISIDDPEGDKQLLTNNIMTELCQKDDEARKNTLNREFKIDDIKTIKAFDKDYVKIFLKWFEKNKGYLRILPDDKISLTDLGRSHCKVFVTHGNITLVDR